MKKTALDIQLDELIMHSIKRRKKASERTVERRCETKWNQQDEVENEEQDGGRKKKDEEEEEEEGSVERIQSWVSLWSCFAVENRSNPRGLHRHWLRESRRLDGILIASIKLDARSLSLSLSLSLSRFFKFN